MIPVVNIKKKPKREINKARCSLTPALTKKNTVAFSLKPKPPMDMGSNVIAPIIGMKIKKYRIFALIPKDKAAI